jgi:hypothetical protein
LEGIRFHHHPLLRLAYMSNRYPLPFRQSKMSVLLPARPASASTPPSKAKPYKKGKIPKALREALWLKYCGKSFEVKCHTTWCQNQITAYDFQAGHNVPECRGGPTTLENLVPICSRCNLSMGSQYTFAEWCALKGEQVEQSAKPKRGWLERLFCCMSAPAVAAQVAPYQDLPAGPVIGAQPPDVSALSQSQTQSQTPRTPRAKLGTRTPRAASSPSAKRPPPS